MNELKIQSKSLSNYKVNGNWLIYIKNCRLNNYGSTDLTLTAAQIIEISSARFSIELAISRVLFPKSAPEADLPLQSSELDQILRLVA